MGGYFLKAPENDHALRFDYFWNEADKLLECASKSCNLIDLYEFWQKPPYGLKSGLLPFFATIYLLTRRDKVALYLNDTFRPEFDDLILDYLLRAPKMIKLRWVDYNQETLMILDNVKGAINSVSSLHLDSTSISSSFEIAKSLVSLVNKFESMGI